MDKTIVMYIADTLSGIKDLLRSSQELRHSSKETKDEDMSYSYAYAERLLVDITLNCVERLIKSVNWRQEDEA